MGRSGNSLVKLIAECKWGQAKELLEENGNLVRKWSVAPSLTGGVAASDILPIHQACKSEGCTIDFFESLLWAYPESISLPESGFKRLPLSIAIRSRQSDDVILFLLEKYPDSASTQDLFGRVSLHYAISNHSSMDVIRRLLSVCPSASYAEDNLGWTPLHVAANMARSVEMVKELVKYGPEAVVCVTKKGNTPLMCTQISTGPDRELIKVVLRHQEELFEETAYFKNYREAESEENQIHNGRTGASVAGLQSRFFGVRKLKKRGSFRIVV
jgi:ankyrin repeat protein